MNNLKRYNRGFGGFGPLEQCDTGELVKYSDVRWLELSVDMLDEDLDLLELENDHLQTEVIIKNKLIFIALSAFALAMAANVAQALQWL